MDVIAETGKRLAALQVHRKMWKPMGGPEYIKLVIDLFNFSLLDELCRIYIDPSTAPEQRAEIRRLAWDDLNVIGQLYSYIDRTTKEFNSTGDIEWLKLGLAAVSIENLQLDYRDSYTKLGKLYRAAIGVGIDPLPHFQHVASISSAEDMEPGVRRSTRDFLADFHKSAYFSSAIKPKLNRKQRP